MHFHSTDKGVLVLAATETWIDCHGVQLGMKFAHPKGREVFEILTTSMCPNDHLSQQLHTPYNSIHSMNLPGRRDSLSIVERSSLLELQLPGRSARPKGMEDSDLSAIAVRRSNPLMLLMHKSSCSTRMVGFDS